jgi:hypothetical protein
MASSWLICEVASSIIERPPCQYTIASKQNPVTQVV